MFDAFETSHEFCVVTEYAIGELFDVLQGNKRYERYTPHINPLKKIINKTLTPPPPSRRLNPPNLHPPSYIRPANLCPLLPPFPPHNPPRPKTPEHPLTKKRFNKIMRLRFCACYV